MSKLYASCPVHGPFETEVFGGTNIEVTFTGNLVSCPICGRKSPLLDGTFEFDEYGIAEFISGPEVTRAVYERFKQLVDSVKTMPEEEFNPEEFLQQTEQISPKLAQGLNHYIQKSGVSLSDKNIIIGLIFQFLTLVLGIMNYLKDDKPTLPTNTYNINNQYFVDKDGNETPYRNNKLGFYPKSKQESVRIELLEHDKVIDPTHTESAKKAKKRKRRKHHPSEIITETIIERTDSTKQIIQRVIRRK